ncbi:MAG: zinc-ribbon domain-containing protein [Acetobacteraceae bacterium]|jgi:predicted Zn finger-like uncharacterized protein
MRIVCPSCSATYDVPDSLVTAGRVVRCARCDGEWTPVEASAVPPEKVSAPPADDVAAMPAEEVAPEPPPADPALPVPDAPAPETPANRTAATRPQSAMDRLVAQSTRPQSSTHLRLAWVASLVLLVLAAGAAYTWRAQIIAAWPPSAHAYAAVGLHPQTEAPQ